MKTTWDSFISITSFGNGKPITEFSETFFKRNPDHKELFNKYVPTGEIVIISGSGFEVSWTEPHDCGCHHYEHEDDDCDEFFTKKEEAENKVKELEERKFSDIEDIEINDGIFFIKAIKQKFHKDGELF